MSISLMSDYEKCELFDFLWSETTEWMPKPDADFPATDLYYVSTDEKVKWVNSHYQIVLQAFLSRLEY